MKKLFTVTIILLVALSLKAQEWVDPITTSDWDQLWKSSFIQSNNGTNAPEPSGWFWGINMNHSTNTSSYRYNGQIAIKNDHDLPTLYFRSTNQNGIGLWTKALHETGNQKINGALTVRGFKINTSIPSQNTYEVQKWTNSHSSLYDLSLKTKWDITGINHFFVQKFNGQDYHVLAFHKGNIGIGTNSPSSRLEIATLFNGQDTYEVQKWTNSHSSSYNLSLKTKWDISGINHFFVQKFNGQDHDVLAFYQGNVGIGTTNPDARLAVKGQIHTQEVKVDLN